MNLKKYSLIPLLLTVLWPLAEPPAHAQAPGMTKREFFDQVLAPARGLQPLRALAKPEAFIDRKRSVMDVGKLVVRLSNGAVLGYDRWGLNHLWPAGGDLTYYWTLAPMVGGRTPRGLSVAIGTRGAARDHEEEYQPLPGYDAGKVIDEENLGIAMSDVPQSWPANWPRDPYTDGITKLSFNIEQPLDQDHSEGRGLRFPGSFNGKVVADRECYFVVTDNDPADGNIASANDGVGPLNIRVDLWGLQWSDVLNEDFIIWKQIVTNIGADTLKDVYIGMHGDPDTPEQGTNEWTDDFALFIPPNSPTHDPLLWNTVLVWDGDDRAQGFIEKNVPWIAMKVLETPVDPATGRQRGLTTMYLFDYSSAAQSDRAAYAELSFGIQPPDNVAPHPNDFTQTPNSYGPDITFVFASGPFDLPPGESLHFVLADILGANRADVLNNAVLAQVLYNNDYKAAEPPKEPWLRAVPGDGSVTLYWDAEPSESSSDRLTKNNRFQGYRIFRSDDRGRTWGTPITDVNGTVVAYVPLAQFDLNDDITGIDPLSPYLTLGSNTGLAHKYVDNNVINGYEYWYAVTAYDSRDEFKVNPNDPSGIPVPPLENSRKNNPNFPGDNTVAVVPLPRVAGFKPGQLTGPERVSGHGTGDLLLELINEVAVISQEYTLKFESTAGGLRFNLTNQAGETVLSNVTAVNGEETIPVFNGIRLRVLNDPDNVLNTRLAGFFVGNTDQRAATNYTVSMRPQQALNEGDYEVRFTAAGDTSLQLGANPAIAVPFEIWNVYDRSAPVQVDFFLSQASSDSTPEMRRQWTSGDEMTIREKVAGRDRFTWKITLSAPVEGEAVLPQTGDVARAYLTHPFQSEDAFKITTSAAGAEATTADLAAVRVVPNPYRVASVFETTLINKEIQFRHLPVQCTIRIYNLAGELVKTIAHTNGTSMEPWNLRTYNDQEISFGIYFYHITLPNGQQAMGKFAVVK
ncbi:T9SS type A sorting domain-containing protein [candidate division KSB1 bacterium]|nr:T9SS type A sorting domain-containing protein [bacterium]NUM65790.1 T9SS type A sorting domain-containing protein [candidate division KSB1 bacterium]